TSTRRNGTDTDIYVESPSDLKTDRMLTEVKGGGWDIQDWSPDDSQLLVIEEISINESYLWLFDTQSGERKELTPRPAEGAEKVPYSRARFGKDGKGIFVTTDRDSEFQRLAYVDLASGRHTPLISEAKWDVGGRDISGFLYLPGLQKFPGPRPVVVNIHGGPEAQFRPGFLGRNNYIINELGCAMIFPNVRGSEGYGKRFLKLDNGFKREDSYKDISALLDWLPSRPELDPAKVMVTGGSYGGFMTLQVAWNYADRIRCAVDVVGMSNLTTFLKNTESYRRDLRRVEYGDERDPKMAEFLERIAALNNAQKITKPLFVVQGANDPRVPKTEAEQIVATLKKQE